MSAVPVDAAPTIDVSSTPRVSFGRLVSVELRKMWNTRAGFWLLLVTGLLVLLALVIPLLAVAFGDVKLSASAYSQIMTIPVSVLVPVLAITSVTSEWSQRTGLVTFALEPHRMRVIAAKLSAVLILGLITMLLAVAMGALGTVLGAAIGGYDARWNLEAAALGWTLLSQLQYLLMGFAFGLVFLSTPAAIAIYYVVAMLLPFMVYGVLYGFFEWAQDIIPWIDMGYAAGPLMGGMSADGSDVLRVLVTTVMWVALPLAIGLRRVAQAELK